MNDFKQHKIEETFKKEHVKVFSFIRRRINRQEDAEDLLQEVFEQALGSLNSLQTIESMLSWIFSIANNKVIDWYRKRKLKTYSLDEHDQDVSINDILEEWDTFGVDEEIHALIAEKLHQNIEQLPEEQRFVLTEQAIKGRSFKKIAKETGIPLNTLLARKRYAVKTLRKELKSLITKVYN